MFLLIFEKLAEVWIEVFGAICVLSVGWAWGRWRAGQAWKQKKFTNRMVLSLNTLINKEVEENGKKIQKPALQLRTIFEKDALYVFQNEVMADILSKCIKKVTPDDCLVHFEKNDSWYMLNSILNQIAESFNDGLMKKDMGLEVTSKWYTFCVTYELDGSIRTHKPRIMIIARDVLSNFPDKTPDHFILEAETHKTRVETLQHLKKQKLKYPHLFMDVELCF